MSLTLLQILIRLLAMLAIIGALADIVTTNKALTLVNVKEGNPVVAFIMRLVGQKWVIFRLLFVMVALFNAFRLDNSWQALVLLAVGDALSFYAATSNYLLYNKQKRLQ